MEPVRPAPAGCDLGSNYGGCTHRPGVPLARNPGLKEGGTVPGVWAAIPALHEPQSLGPAGPGSWGGSRHRACLLPPRVELIRGTWA